MPTFSLWEQLTYRWLWTWGQICSQEETCFMHSGGCTRRLYKWYKWEFPSAGDRCCDSSYVKLRQCLVFFCLYDQTAPLGVDALAHEWPTKTASLKTALLGEIHAGCKWRLHAPRTWRLHPNPAFIFKVVGLCTLTELKSLRRLFLQNRNRYVIFVLSGLHGYNFKKNLISF